MLKKSSNLKAIVNRLYRTYEELKLDMVNQVHDFGFASLYRTYEELKQFHSQ